MELYDSFVRIVFDPDGAAMVLIDYGTPLWGQIEINGEQMVQETSFIRGAGIKAFPRGNERNALRFEKAGLDTDLYDSFASRLDGIITLPRYQADVLIELQAGRKWRLKNAAVKAWPGVFEPHIVNKQGVEIVGGQIIEDATSYAPGITWGDLEFKWENIG